MIKNTLGCYDWVKKNNEYFFSAMDYHFLCKGSDSGEIQFLFQYETEKEKTKFYSSPVIIHDDKVFTVPFNLQNLYIYDIKDNIKKVLNIDNTNRDIYYLNNIQTENYWTSYAYNEYVYFFGWNSGSIMKLNIHNYTIEYITDWIKNIPKDWLKSANYNNSFFGNGYVRLGDNIYIASGIGPAIWKLSLDIKNIEYIKLDCESKGFNTISLIENKIILTEIGSEVDRIILCDIDTNKIKEIKLSEKSYWRSPVIYNYYIYLFPCIPNGHVIRVNSSTLECEKYDRFDKLLSNSKDDYFVAVKQNNNTVSFIRESDYCWFTYDFDREVMTYKYYKVPDNDYVLGYKTEYYDEVFCRCEKSGSIFNEKELPLLEYIKRI